MKIVFIRGFGPISFLDEVTPVQIRTILGAVLDRTEEPPLTERDADFRFDATTRELTAIERSADATTIPRI
jgi:hypothetical protein